MDAALSPALERLHAVSDELIEPELYARLVEALPDALVVTKDGKIALFNAQAELLFGYHRSEILGRLIEVLVPEDARERHVAHRGAFSQRPQARSMAVDLPLAARHKDGHEFPVQINLSPLITPSGLYVSAVVRRKA